MPKRKFPQGWINAYRQYVGNQESPEQFHLWVGLTMISASLRRHVWINRGAYQVYPNQYVLLVAESASCRKSVAMKLGLELLRPLKSIRVVHEKCTVEGLIDTMPRTFVSPTTGKIIEEGPIMIHADELSNLFGKATYTTDLISFLTAAYTSSAELEFLTRNKGYKKISAPCPVLLGGTVPDQIGEIFPVLTLASGFMGRIVMVLGKRGKRVSYPEVVKEMKQPLIDDLYQMSQLEGEVTLTPDCEKMYDDWYMALTEAPSPEMSAFFERKHDHVLKTAMLLSISDSDRKVITCEHLEMAIEAIDLVETWIPRAVDLIGATEESKVLDLVLRIIRRNTEGIAYSILLRKLQRRIKDASQLQEILDRLQRSGYVEAHTREGRSAIYYKPLSPAKEVKDG